MGGEQRAVQISWETYIPASKLPLSQNPGVPYEDELIAVGRWSSDGLYEEQKGGDESVNYWQFVSRLFRDGMSSSSIFCTDFNPPLSSLTVIINCVFVSVRAREMTVNGVFLCHSTLAFVLLFYIAVLSMQKLWPTLAFVQIILYE